MKFKTWDEWKEEGYFIRYGEKSTKRNEKGVALFSEEQVVFDDNFLDDYSEMYPDEQDLY